MGLITGGKLIEFAEGPREEIFGVRKNLGGTMKTKYPSMFGLLAVFMLVASLVVPANMANPAPVQAYDPICQWDYVTTPKMMSTFTRDILSPSEVNKLVAGSDGATLWAVDTANSVMASQASNAGGLYRSTNGGITWSGSPFDYLVRDLDAASADHTQYNPVWDVAIAPDDVNFVAVVLDDVSSSNMEGGRSVWVTTDGGTSWQDTNFSNSTDVNDEIISCIDISPEYGGVRDILVGTRSRDELANGGIYVLKAPGFTAWTDQNFPVDTVDHAAGNGADVYAAKFSPTYVGDAGIVVIASPFTNTANTYAYIGIRDLAVGTPSTTWTGYTPVEIKDPTSSVNSSPGVTQMVTVDLELPSDFSAATASLRRFYISDDAETLADNSTCTGIFRIDNTVVYELMDTSGMFWEAQGGKRISSIAYYGTYASGKLLAGEVRGYACTATVPTWFTDSPTTCPIPCWYPALKPTTGAAAIDACTLGTLGWGNAQVVWRVDGALALIGTSSALLDAGGVEITGDYQVGDTEWPAGYLRGLQWDESAFGISRNNGETWNQLTLIDTRIDEFTDVAPAADCSTVYLASINSATANGRISANCTGFDSVWRSGTAANVVAPLPALPLGTYWERVLCHVTAADCDTAQSEHAILRLAPDKTDGQIVFWAAGGTGALGDWGGNNTQRVMWTPDYGDYWANINPRLPVQDMAAASSTKLYVLGGVGEVQTMPYTGTAWSSALATVDVAGIGGSHSIAAYGDDYVLVGPWAASSAAPAALSSGGGTSFTALVGTTGDAGRVHVAFDPAFADNSIIYSAFDNYGDAGLGNIWRYQVGAGASWTPMLGLANGGFGSQHIPGYYGLALAYTGGALYGAHDLEQDAYYTGVERTLNPTGGLPKPGITWDCLNVFARITAARAAELNFTEEPSSLKLCGCLTLDTDTTLYAIDNHAYVTNTIGGLTTGGLWGFSDCMAKVGPTLTMEDGTLIGCDPVSGRNQEINFTWEQLCLAYGYDIEIAKDEIFSLKVFDWVSGTTMTSTAFYTSSISTVPTMIFPVGAATTAWPTLTQPALISQLECGHTYYWKAQVRSCATGQIIRSPWSEVRSFTIKAGLPVSADYYGLKLLSPDNGCMGCAVSPASFSWSPFKGTTKYKFVLAKDAALTDVLAEAEVATTAYEYDGTLDYSTNYFWRVMCVEPAPSDWSATFSFQTEAAPAAQEAPPEAPGTPMWVWVIIAMGAILVIVTLVLIFKTRRV